MRLRNLIPRRVAKKTYLCFLQLVFCTEISHIAHLWSKKRNYFATFTALAIYVMAARYVLNIVPNVGNRYIDISAAALGRSGMRFV